MSDSKGAVAADKTSMQSARSFLFTITLTIAVILVTSLSQVSSGLIPQWLQRQRPTYSALWPQAWTFFAGAPTTDTVVAYRLQSDGGALSTRNVLNIPLSSARNLWGLSQDGSTQQIEIHYLTSLIPERFWVPCGQTASAGCQTSLNTAPVFSMPNTFQAPALCGRIAFVIERPRPMALATTQPNAPRHQIKATLAQLSCPR